VHFDRFCIDILLLQKLDKVHIEILLPFLLELQQMLPDLFIVERALEEIHLLVVIVNAIVEHVVGLLVDS
jgi:hypothetical protein